MRTGILELRLEIVDDGSTQRQRWNGDPMASAEADRALTSAVTAAEDAVRRAGMLVARTSYGVKAEDHA